jgi:hypothetical protein
MLVADHAGRLLSFNATAEKLLGVDLARFRGAPLFGVNGLMPRASRHGALEAVLRDAAAPALDHAEDVSVTTAGGSACSWT